MKQIEVPNSSGRFRRALEKGIQSYLSANDPLAAELTGPDSFGLEVFSMELDEVAKGRHVETLTSTGWNFFPGKSMGGAVYAEVSEMDNGEARMTALVRDKDSVDVVAALRELDHLLDKDSRYVAQIITIPGLLLEAFLLRNLSGGSHVIVPYLASSGPFKERQRVSADQFMEMAKELAPSFMEFDSVDEIAGEPPSSPR